jgi:excisionase family DNA binding protein
MPEELLTVKQAARILKVDIRTIYRWAGLGKIPSVKMNRSVRIPRDELIEWINGKKREARNEKTLSRRL